MVSILLQKLPSDSKSRLPVCLRLLGDFFKQNRARLSGRNIINISDLVCASQSCKKKEVVSPWTLKVSPF